MKAVQSEVVERNCKEARPLISRLQFISREDELGDHLFHIRQALRRGVKWIQLRVKSVEYADFVFIAKNALQLCNQHGAKLIVNDDMSVAHTIGAAGVHLGLEDTPIAEARKFLGVNAIIGATAYTIEEMRGAYNSGADYIGLGPLRFTATKEASRLKPILGMAGIRRVIESAMEAGIEIPIIVVGGVLASDVEELLQFGAHGVAVSKAIADGGEGVVESFGII